MNVAEKIIDSVDTVTTWFSQSLLMQDFAAYCDLETTEDHYTLVNTDGGLLSIIKIVGSREVAGKEEMIARVEQLHHRLKGYMQDDDSHMIGVFFERDPGNTRRDAKRALAPAYATANRLQMNVKDILDDRIQTYAKHCSSERAYLCLWTIKGGLTKDTYKREIQERLDYVKKHSIPPSAHAQNVLAALRKLKTKHETFVTAVRQDFGHIGIMVSPLEVHDAVRELRISLLPDLTTNEWRPALVGDKIRPNAINQEDDISNIIYPKISYQIGSHKTTNENLSNGLEAVRAYNRIYVPFMMDRYPQEPQYFSKLLTRIPKDIPWRIAFIIEPNGIKKLGFKKMLVSIFGFMSQTNKDIKKAFDDLVANSKDDPAMRLRIAFATWGTKPEELEHNFSTITRAVQGWGICDTTNDCGDALSGLASTVPGFTKANIAPPAVAPLSDTIKMLPLDRPASPWDSAGTILFRTLDGKLYPFANGSSLQNAWIDLIFAPMGSGKSTLQNMMAWSSCLSPGITRIPPFLIIDVGPSSLGAVRIIKGALPPDQKHLAEYFRLRNDSKCGINSFDTNLGCRFPTRLDRDFLVNFLTLVCTPAGRASAPGSTSELVGLIIDEAYKKFADKDGGEPKLYRPGRDQLVDDAVARIGLEVDDCSTWWNVVDGLFKEGLIREASRAQRFAVPTLPDLSMVSRIPAIRDIYEPENGRAVTVDGSGDTLLSHVNRMFSSAAREYPILSGETQFDLGDTRFIALDLNDVAKGGGDAGKKQSALMYMLARNIGARSFFFHKDMLGELTDPSPSFYHAYHAERVKDVHQDMKTILFDEYHRTGNQKPLRESLLTDAREGRKANLRIGLASQLLDDFDKEMVEIATNIFIMKGGNPDYVKQIKEKFGLSATAAELLARECHGPPNFMAIFDTKHGRFIQLLANTMSGIEMWGLSTTKEDADLRDYLYEKIGEVETRKLLSIRYPGGSAKEEIERRRARLGVLDEESANNDIIRNLAEELVANA